MAPDSTTTKRDASRRQRRFARPATRVDAQSAQRPVRRHSAIRWIGIGLLMTGPVFAVLAAIWFGVKGGVATAVGITLLTLPYPKVKGITDRHTLIGEYTEMVFYIAIGLVAGILIEQQWRERRRREKLDEELAVKKRLSSLGQMAAGLAHEIKNPLGSIHGAAEILSDDLSDDPKKPSI